MAKVVLTACQEAAARMLDGFLQDAERSFALIRGPGGSGKTFLLEQYFGGRRGCEIMKLAPTHQAKRQLDRSMRAGGPARTLAGFFGLTMVTHPATLKDDGGLSCFFTREFVGRADVTGVAMREVVRQCDERVKQNLRYMRGCIRRNADIDLGALVQTPAFRMVPSLLDHLEAFNEGADVRALAWRNKTVDALNIAIRRLVNGAEDREGFVQNDTVTFTCPYRNLVNNGDTFVIAQITEGLVDVYEDDGGVMRSFLLECFRMAPTEAKSESVTVYRFKDPEEFRAERRIVETRVRATDDLKERDAVIRRQLRALKDHHAEFKIAFSSTVHRAQGATISTVLVDAEDIVSSWDVGTRNRLLYTAVSRMRDSAIISVGRARAAVNDRHGCTLVHQSRGEGEGGFHDHAESA